MRAVKGSLGASGWAGEEERARTGSALPSLVKEWGGDRPLMGLPLLGMERVQCSCSVRNKRIGFAPINDKEG